MGYSLQNSILEIELQKYCKNFEKSTDEKPTLRWGIQ